MIIRRAMLSVALLAIGSLFASAASAQEPKDKSITEQAREQARERLHELREAELAAKQKLREAEQKLREAERQLKSAASDAKLAAEKAVGDAKQALDAAKLEAGTAGTRTIQAIRELKTVSERSFNATLEAAHEKAHDAKDKVAGKAAELKADVAHAAAQARNEAEGAAEHAGTTVRHMQNMAREIMRDAVDGTGEGAMRKQARRAAWRRLAGQAERPRDVPPSVREELRRHAQRIARLRRIRFVATEKNERALVVRTDALIARETARHEKRLPALWEAAAAKRGADHGKGTEDEEQEPAEETVEEDEEQP